MHHIEWENELSISAMCSRRLRLTHHRSAKTVCQLRADALQQCARQRRRSERAVVRLVRGGLRSVAVAMGCSLKPVFAVLALAAVVAVPVLLARARSDTLEKPLGGTAAVASLHDDQQADQQEPVAQKEVPDQIWTKADVMHEQNAEAAAATAATAAAAATADNCAGDDRSDSCEAKSADDAK